MGMKLWGATAQEGIRGMNPYSHVVRSLRARYASAILFSLLVISMNILPEAVWGNPVLALDAGTATMADTLPASEPVPETPMQTGSSLGETASRFRLGYHTFTDEKMSESYENSVVGSWEGIGWGKKVGFGFEVGWWGGSGTPIPVESDWTITESSLKMTAFSIAINFLYYFKEPAEAKRFIPYTEIGPTLWFGWEKITATAERSVAGIEDGFNAELSGIGISYGACAMLGTLVRISEGFSLLFEVRGTLSSSDDMFDLIGEDEEQSDYDSSLYTAVQRPGFNFTGWRIDVGFQW